MINVTKSQPAPPCLEREKNKKNGDYKCGEVLERLNKDFKNKCYLCEESAISSINVEHFKPHKGDKNLKFDWNNLFFSCSHCNNTKLDKYENILNCTDSSVVIVNMLQFEIKPFPKEKVKIIPLSNDFATLETAKLLNEIYNGTTCLKGLESENLRDKLIREIRVFGNLLQDYYEVGATEEEKKEISQRIKRKLSPESAFTAFKIWIIKANERLLNDFGAFLPFYK